VVVRHFQTSKAVEGTPIALGGAFDHLSITGKSEESVEVQSLA
jgi:hypothetical protein